MVCNKDQSSHILHVKKKKKEKETIPSTERTAFLPSNFSQNSALEDWQLKATYLFHILLEETLPFQLYLLITFYTEFS